MSISLDDLYKIFSPKDISALKIQSGIAPESIEKILQRLFLDPSCQFYTHKDIEAILKEHFSKTSKPEEAKLGKELHVIGPKSYVDLGDADYWKDEDSTGNYGLTTMIPSLADSSMDAAMADFTPSAYIVRAPFVNPAVRGTDKISMFLNNMPSIVVSQMTPYLDVEFDVGILGAKKPFINTPGPLRFLLGSAAEDTLSPGDKKIYNSEISTDDALGVTHSITGMEHFLMPQTLTNMESLGPSASRLVSAQPFLPFASILGFDVSINNAGAAKFAHKKGTLKIAIHDKSRLGEMSAFIRGSSGFYQTVVWITYGWLAPMNSSAENEYTDFINKNMMVKECWQVTNSQFSFDASGQVSLTLELLSKAGKLLQEIRVSELSAYMKEFHETIQTIARLKDKIVEENKFAINVQTEQILNIGSTNGDFTAVKSPKLQASLNNLITSLKRGTLDEAELNDLKKSLKSLTGAEKFSQSKLDATVGTDVKNQFDKLRNGVDPFLASDKKLDFFQDPNLVEIVTKITKTAETRNKIAASAKPGSTTPAKNASAASQPVVISSPMPSSLVTDESADYNQYKKRIDERRKPIVLNDTRLQAAINAVIAADEDEEAKQKQSELVASKITADNAAALKSATIKANLSKTKFNTLKQIVSFGKLFLYFLVPAVAKSHTCSELQVFFYGLNDSCGPLSEQSIAEFPIDVNKFAHVYLEHLKTSGSEDISLESFMKLIIQTQFSDHRSIGFGMNTFYKAWSPEEPSKEEVKENPETQSGLAQWHAKYGSLKLPMIEIYVESGVADTDIERQGIVAHLKRGSSQERREQTNKNKIIKRIHIYDKHANPYRLMQSVINTGTEFQLGEINTGKVRENLETIYNKLDSRQKVQFEELMSASNKATEGSKKSVQENLQRAGAVIEDVNGIMVMNLPFGKKIKIGKDRKLIKSLLMMSVPSISFGINGSLVTSVNVASATNGLMGTLNIINASKNQASGKATLSDNGLENAGGLPLRAIPVQVTMTTLGVPTSQLYQTFFLDFNTGTTIDNIYNCTQLQHSITPGKFTSNWTFAYTDGYGKFFGPPSDTAIVSGQMNDIIDKAKEAATASSSHAASAKKK